MTELTEEDIDRLVVPATAVALQKPLPIGSKRKLKILLHCYHDCCRTVGIINTTSLSRSRYNEYHISTYNPSKPLQSWKFPLPKVDDI